MNAAEKGLYQNATIPDANNYYDQMSTAFGLRVRNLRIDKDFSHIPVLQDDKKTLADARKSLNDALKIEWDNNILTLDEWRVKNGEDPLVDGRGKLYKYQYRELYGWTETTITGQAQGTQANPGATGAAQEGQAAASQSN
jgi:hypothetical protein